MTSRRHLRSRQRWIRVEAGLFADCSGDSVLRLSGSRTRWGREPRFEFGESLALEVGDPAYRAGDLG